jgi:hypothetical protein
MQATLIQADRIRITDESFVEVAIWQVPQPVRGSTHVFKYRLAYVVSESCVLRYDNETGKGDHKHMGGREVPYLYSPRSID